MEAVCNRVTRGLSSFRLCLGRVHLDDALVFKLVSMVKQRGRGELTQGELMRFFAEVAWYPRTFPSQGGALGCS